MTLSAVNFPEIALPLTEGKHRLLHIHKNIPGVLSKINNLFAEHGINISGQSLMTKGDVGYLVMDVDATASKKHSIRFTKLKAQSAFAYCSNSVLFKKPEHSCCGFIFPDF